MTALYDSSLHFLNASTLHQCTVAPPQHFLYFFPDPHGQGSLRPTLGAVRRGGGANSVLA